MTPARSPAPRFEIAQRVGAVLAGVALLLLLSSCSHLGWGERATAKVSVDFVRSGQAPSSRAPSGAGGDLQVPDLVTYVLVVMGSDMDTVMKAGPIGSISAEVPVGTGRIFHLILETSQASYEGTEIADISGAASVTVNMALSDTDFFFPVSTSGSHGIARADLTVTGAFDALAADFTQAASFTDPLGGTISPSLNVPFAPGDCAVDDEGFLYLADGTIPSGDAPAILKIRDSSGSLLADTYLVRDALKPEDASTATGGICSIAIDRTNGFLYFCQLDEGWFYKKSLKMWEGGINLRYQEQKVMLPAGSNIKALDCAPDGRIFLVRRISGSYYLDQYAANPPTDGSVPSTVQGPVLLASGAVDLQVSGSYLYVLTSGAPIVQRFDAANLVMTPTNGGTPGSDNSVPGNFNAPSRFLLGPKDRLYVMVATPGGRGMVSFTDQSFADTSFSDWAYSDVESNY